jgi:2-dehydro-3-deoxygluconokinase
MEFKNNALYDIVVPTSMGLRITPINAQPIHISDQFRMQVTSAETNAISAPAALGLKVKTLTAFVKESPIAAMIKKNLKSRHIDFEGPEIEQGGPWGYRHQINIADSGYGLRAPRVHNDRAGEVGRILSTKYFDLEKLFLTDGVKLIHISGLIAALSPESGEFCLELAKTAAKYGTKVSFDINYRASFWKDRTEDLSRIFRGIASYASLLIGNEEDFQLALGVKGPESGGNDINKKLESFKAMIASMKDAYPNAELFTTTLREVNSANSHEWGAILTDQKVWHVIEPRQIGVLDRIGGGDGYVGGLLYGLLTGMSLERACQFGWANGAFTATLLDDYSQPLSEEQIFSVWEGNARVRR